ncbi:carbohydrate-binding protein [Streptomyces sp. NPDC001339]|uniref:carbohydrate-binding protein n=1 Tax=Streptomyces sp. NPDC001339 TaxID=3364563 RepID=UPI00369288A1
MTAGNNGAGTPENDDPFAYLYRSEGGEGGAAGPSGDGVAAARQPGVPRASYNQVRAVGERQYGQRQQHGGAQQRVAPQQPYGQQPYAQRNAHYAAPETLPGGDATRQVAPPGHTDRAPAPRRNHKGLLIGAVAVVTVVCIGIGVAILTNSNDDKNDSAADPVASADASTEPSEKPSGSPTPAPLPKENAGSLSLGGGATTSKDVKGARTPGGTYVAGMNAPGASATWTLDVPKSGAYTVFVGYGVPGKDAKSTLTINDQDTRKINMKNFAHAAEGDWEKGWTRSFSWVQLKQGKNTVKVSCEQGDQCDFNLDQVWLKAGHVKG